MRDVARGAAKCRAILADEWARNTRETPALREFVERLAGQPNDPDALLLWTYFTATAFWEAKFKDLVDEMTAHGGEVARLRAESDRLAALLVTVQRRRAQRTSAEKRAAGSDAALEWFDWLRSGGFSSARILPRLTALFRTDRAKMTERLKRARRRRREKGGVGTANAPLRSSSDLAHT